MSDVSGAGGGNRQINLGDVVRNLEGVRPNKQVKLNGDGTGFQAVGFLGRIWSSSGRTRFNENFEARSALRTAFFAAQNNEVEPRDLPAILKSSVVEVRAVTVQDIRAVNDCLQARAAPQGPVAVERPDGGPDGGTGRVASFGPRESLTSDASDVSEGLAGPSSEQAEGAGSAGTESEMQEWRKAIAEGAELPSGGPDESVAATARSEQRTPRQLFGETLLDGNPKVETPSGRPDESVAGTISDPRNEPGALLGDKVLDPSFVPLAEPRPEIVDQDAETVSLDSASNDETQTPEEARRKLNAFMDNGTGDLQRQSDFEDDTASDETTDSEERQEMVDSFMRMAAEERQESVNEFMRMAPEERQEVVNEFLLTAAGDGKKRVRFAEPLEIPEPEEPLQHASLRQSLDIIRNFVESEMSRGLSENSLSTLLEICSPGVFNGSAFLNNENRGRVEQQWRAQIDVLQHYKTLQGETPGTTLETIFSNPDLASIFHGFADRENLGHLSRLFESAQKAINAITRGQSDFNRYFDEARTYYRIGADEKLPGFEADAQMWKVEDDGEAMALLNFVMNSAAGQMEKLLGSFNHFVGSL